MSRKKLVTPSSERSEDFVPTRRAGSGDIECTSCKKTFPPGKVQITGIGTFKCPACGEENNHSWDRITEANTTTGPSVGEKITVTWGEESIQVARFQQCNVGPFIYETTVREGETIDSALKRANAHLAMFAASVRKEKVAEFRRLIAEVQGE